MIDDLQAAAPKTRVVRDKRFVDNGKIVTAAGLSSGIDGALHVIEKLYGKGAAQVAAVSPRVRLASGLGLGAREPGRPARSRRPTRRSASISRTVVRHEGTRDRWETCWKIRTTAPAPPTCWPASTRRSSVRQRMGEGECPDRPAASESRWRFRDADGRGLDRDDAGRAARKGADRVYSASPPVIRRDRGRRNA